MSGLCGIVALDGAVPSASEIEALARRLDHRGPDGTRVVHDGPAALGLASLATTPEALVEMLPLRDAPSGCTITADARIDNRDELLATLGGAGACAAVGDGALILRAYLEWGEHCPARLLGDFAFAIWDPRSATLFCARDQIGMRQLTYLHRPGERFLFATEPSAVALHDGVDCPVNRDRVADYLGGMEGADLTSTFFENIVRLPPAHSLKLDAHGLAVRRYWSLEPRPVLRLPSDKAYAEAFLAVFTKAVECRLRSARPVAAMLSGGLDSNAVVAIASRLVGEAGGAPLATFSAVGPDPAPCVETKAIKAAIAAHAIAPTTLCFADLGDLRPALVDQTRGAAEPFDSNMVMIRSVYLAARAAGHNVVLDGAGGDVVFASNFHSAALLRRGQWRAAWRDESGAGAFWGPAASFPRGLASAAWQAFAPLALRAFRFHLGRRRANRRFAAATRGLGALVDQPRALRRRRAVQRRAVGFDRIDDRTHLRAILHPNLVIGRERYDRVAAANGIEPRDPFLDLRVIDFCLSLPREQRQRDGWPKWLLRTVVDELAGPAIAWRRGKQHLGAAFTASIVEELRHPGAPKFDGATDRPPFSFETDKRLAGSEITFLLNWFASMRRQGWTSGATSMKEIHHDDQSEPVD